ncbi:MAG: hypothetical protein ACK41W_00040 [Cyanobacteriota bacterium]|jgi:hypothetical protein
MIRTEPDTVIYIFAPAHIVTGGIEAVHQLVDKLRKFGHDARIVPLPVVKNPTLLQYRNYEVAFAASVDDNPRNILITTEVNPKLLDHYRFIQKALWWLSVDNHEDLAEKFDFADSRNQDILHFAQSAYARAFLRQKGVESIHDLSDFLHATYLNTSKRRGRTDAILYTPVKGAQEHVNRLRKADPSLQWLPLKGMIRKHHARTLSHGKVYVDFGRHPGKDRQPREAAINGCCVIVGLLGSARFEEDIPIASAYKFSVELLDERRILETIRSCLFDYETRRADFEGYAEIIRQEENRFEQEVVAIFGVKSWRQRSPQLISLFNTLRYVRENHPLQAARGLANELLPLDMILFAKRLYSDYNAKLLPSFRAGKRGSDKP